MPSLATFALGSVALEIDPGAVFLRAGRLECYLRTAPHDPRRWGWHREPGSLEIDAGRLRFTASKAPVAG